MIILHCGCFDVCHFISVCVLFFLILRMNFSSFLSGVSRGLEQHECDFFSSHADIKQISFQFIFLFVDLERVDRCTKSHAI